MNLVESGILWDEVGSPRRRFKGFRHNSEMWLHDICRAQLRRYAVTYNLGRVDSSSFICETFQPISRGWVSSQPTFVLALPLGSTWENSSLLWSGVKARVSLCKAVLPFVQCFGASVAQVYRHCCSVISRVVTSASIWALRMHVLQWFQCPPPLNDAGVHGEDAAPLDAVQMGAHRVWKGRRVSFAIFGFCFGQGHTKMAHLISHRFGSVPPQLSRQ